jgi:hypothetical protein
MSYETWQEKLKAVFDDPGLKTPDDVTPEKFHTRLEEAGITLPGDLVTNLDEFKSMHTEGTIEGEDRKRMEKEWQEFVKDMWALAYLDDPDKERWRKAYSDQEWAQAHPGRDPSQIEPQELRRFVYRKVADRYGLFFHFKTATFPGWII